MAPAQAYVTSYPPRIRQYTNTLLQPVLQTQNVVPGGRTTKRGTTIINYADDAYDEDDFEDSEGPRRPTGLRSLRREELEKREPQNEKVGKEIHEPVDLQPIYRDWIIRRAVRPTTDAQAQIQSQLPLTLIPIRIDLDVPPHQPEAPFPLPRAGVDIGVNPSLPMFKKPEPLPGYKIRDIFLWNLHENLLTPDDFAQCFVRELDLPNQTGLAMNVSQQIRTQLEDYAGVAMHPLFHTQPKRSQMPDTNPAATPSAFVNGSSRGGTPRAHLGASISRPASTTPGTPAASTPHPITLTNGASITAVASPLPPEPQIEQQDDSEDPYLNPDDTYRCVITLSIYLSSKLYQDKFEWSLLHPPGAAEAFARQTCADMGLSGEWVMAITHAIYEAVLRLKKEACEGGMVMIGGNNLSGEIDNQAVRGEEGAGWRYDIDDFGAEWEPKFEALSKEEIEKREGDRERQLRRLRRETAKFSSTAGMVPSAREQEAQQRGSYFDYTTIGSAGTGEETPLMGRGERSKKKRRFRSLSPVAKAQTPDATGSSAGAGWGGEGNRLQEYERQNWRCKHCLIWGSAVWAVRDGPTGPRAQVIANSGHDDMIHDAVLDYYGRRLATCSSDKTIKIFEIDGDQHRLTETLKGHEGAVWCVSWAHPKFGTLLASSSYDGRVHIYRETPSQQTQPGQQSSSSWTLVFTSTFHTASVNMVSWAPPDLGCLLACASSDGQVSVLEFRDNQWGHIIFPAHPMGVNAVSWAPSAPPGAIARKDPGGAPGSSGLLVKRFVTGGSDNNVKIWEFSPSSSTYENALVLPSGHADWVRDVAWSPTLLSKSYIASASQDKTVKIWTCTNMTSGNVGDWTLAKTLEFDAVTWRVSWSLSGNVLAVSGGDNKVTLWKEDLKGNWEMVREVTE
ncbi:uncharacterized protein Z520_06221 [Fonsecaea multimorphosa CBS 102226]|uniref:Protein transport protein SEC13 n=1 Tax=Fonsecaea multimorphosa CBS 102226 TaxID=1442371 RepID=A0A0D2IM88_9EURO|nr:uncharacterized protein Z520_06221 [Fonsecaea multimorphosa CBS 102226]KIX98141.1 hypothetical protein Z520_06221 [Fonsecaea multimorphosa CBS 102226]OAL24216.1 hypothetical protein AYO22_05876 [Fonsecaea multimorphosa]